MTFTGKLSSQRTEQYQRFSPHKQLSLPLFETDKIASTIVDDVNLSIN
jgi:hypothetical protein